MRQIVASVLIVGSFTSHLAAFQAPSSVSTQKPAIKACSLLPKELVAKYYKGNKIVLDMMPPTEEAMGTTGSACDAPGVRLQVDPFRPQSVDQMVQTAKDMVAVAGVGDRAYFRNNRNNYAELLVVAGAHTFTLQMDVPSGSTAEARKPDVIALAKEILPKLK